MSRVLISTKEIGTTEKGTVLGKKRLRLGIGMKANIYLEKCKVTDASNGNTTTEVSICSLEEDYTRANGTMELCTDLEDTPKTAIKSVIEYINLVK